MPKEICPTNGLKLPQEETSKEDDAQLLQIGVKLNREKRIQCQRRSSLHMEGNSWWMMIDYSYLKYQLYSNIHFQVNFLARETSVTLPKEICPN